VLPTQYDPRLLLARQVVEGITEKYGLPVLEPAIPRTVRFGEAPAVGRSALATAGRSRGAEAYRELALRLLAERPGNGAGPNRSTRGRVG
jgi:chromosome partitioning protein